MSFCEFLESKFVASQLALNAHRGKTATPGMAQLQAAKVLLWLALQAITAIYVIVLVIQYLGVLVRLNPPPKPPGQVAAEAEMARKQSEQLAAKIAQELGKPQAQVTPLKQVKA